jgi:hypothetical protein
MPSARKTPLKKSTKRFGGKDRTKAGKYPRACILATLQVLSIIYQTEQKLLSLFHATLLRRGDELQFQILSVEFQIVHFLDESDGPWLMLCITSQNRYPS